VKICKHVMGQSIRDSYLSFLILPSTKKYHTSKCLVLLLLEFRRFTASRIILLLSWWIVLVGMYIPSADSWQCKRHDCRKGTDISAIKMRHLRKARRVCWTSVLTAVADEFGHCIDKQRHVSS